MKSVSPVDAAVDLLALHFLISRPHARWRGTSRDSTERGGRALAKIIEVEMSPPIRLPAPGYDLGESPFLRNLRPLPFPRCTSQIAAIPETANASDPGSGTGSVLNSVTYAIGSWW